jgi:Delta7-sterol 5-desaturase
MLKISYISYKSSISNYRYYNNQIYMYDIKSFQNLFKFIFNYNYFYIFTLITLTLLWVFILPKFFINRKQTELKSPFKLKSQLTRELFFSISSMIIFALVALILNRYLNDIGYYSGYKKITGFLGVIYAFFTFILLFVWHDTFFYWTHRLMHHPLLFRHIHKVHHLSKDVTPLSTISFHPFEAIIQSLALFLLFLLVPISTPVLFIYELIQVIQAFYGHTGYELYPTGFTKHWFFKHIATSTHHNYHHQRIGGHYGRYFTWWDKALGTEFHDYHQKFEELTKSKSK